MKSDRLLDKHGYMRIILRQGCTNPERKIVVATTFCIAAPNICALFVWSCFLSFFWCLEVLCLGRLYILRRAAHLCIEMYLKVTHVVKMGDGQK